MTRAAVAALLASLALGCAACSTGPEETWIGKNVGVTVDSTPDDGR